MKKKSLLALLLFVFGVALSCSTEDESSTVLSEENYLRDVEILRYFADIDTVNVSYFLNIPQ